MHPGRRHFTRTTAAVALATAALVLSACAPGGQTPAPKAAAATATPAPDPTPLTPAEELLATTSDPAACAVSFLGDAIADAPSLQTQGALFTALPIPAREGAVFAGWFPSAEAAAAADPAMRVNGADLVACTDRQLTLHGAWTTPDALAAADVQVPILMYHQFTTNPAGEDNTLRLNYIYTADFDAQMAYLADTGVYLPTWDELSAFIDGRLALPERSAIVTDDDADRTWLELGVPIVEAHGILTTSFVITKWRSEPTPSRFVLQRSHTHDMHDPGADGRGRIVNWTPEQIAADMETSAQILGAKEVMAYPFGHYDATAQEGLRLAGYEMARTIEQGYVHVGSDKLALPCIRVNYGTTLAQFIAAVG